MINKLKTIDIEVALMMHYKVNKKLIVPNVSWGLGIGLHECDLLILTPTGYATEIEIKISKADLLTDKNKKHSHLHNHIKYFYFCVPEKLEEIALTEIPARAGLYVINDKFKIKEVRKPINNKECVKWDEQLMFKLAKLGTMRILTLKKNIIKLNNKYHGFGNNNK